MACAVNYAFANRQLITCWVRDTFSQVMGRKARDLGLELVYDVAHNSAKIEEHLVQGKLRKVCVHRKGATRAFGPGNSQIPAKYRPVGQPVFIPGDMGRASYVLKGTDLAMKETFGSTCHGAGRLMSRTAALKLGQGHNIPREMMEKYGVFLKARDSGTVAEESPEAYKDVNEVVEVVHQLGISKKVAKLRPLATIKG
jgi:tRNA-splicing ligase RtcB